MMVSVGDVRLFVDVDGAKLVPSGASMRERPTIVMLHGNSADHSPFKEVFGAFTQFAQVVYYDHRGNGRSEDGDRERWKLDQWGDDLVALCDVLGIERPILFGVSFGGFVALNSAIRYPDFPAKLVAVSCAARINPESSIRTYERLGGPDVAAVATKFFDDPAGTRAEFLRVCGPYFNPQPSRADVGARIVSRPAVTEHFLQHEYLQHDYRARLADIRCPTLLLGGELDPIVPIDEIEDTARRIRPGLARVVRFHDSGHGTAGVQAAVLELVRDFVLERS